MSIGVRTIEDAPELAQVKQPETSALERRGVALDRISATLIALLVIGVATDRLGIEVGSYNIRSEFIVGAVVALIALVRQGWVALRRFGLVDACLAGWLGANVVSSLFFSPDTAESLKYVALLVGLMTIYAATRLLVRSGASLEWAAVLFAGAGALVAIIGLVCALLFRVIGPNPGILLERFYRDGVFVVTPKVQSILWEPNIYGSFSLSVCAIVAALTLARLQRGDRQDSLIRKLPIGWLYAAGAAGMCGVMLSMTRTVWLFGPALIIGMAIAAMVLKLASFKQIAISVLLPGLVGGLIGFAAGSSLPAPRWEMGSPWELTPAQVDEMVRERLFGIPNTPVVVVQPTPDSNGNVPAPTATPMPLDDESATQDRIGEMLGGPEDAPSVTGRWRIFKDAFEGWLRRPVLGWGAGSFPLVYPPPPEGGYWIANMVLHTMFDTGSVGLLLLLGGIGLAWWRGFKSIHYPTSRWDSRAFVMFGLLSAGAGLLAAYQVTDGSWLGFSWVIVGMIGMTDRRPRTGD